MIAFKIVYAKNYTKIVFKKFDLEIRPKLIAVMHDFTMLHFFARCAHSDKIRQDSELNENRRRTA